MYFFCIFIGENKLAYFVKSAGYKNKSKEIELDINYSNNFVETFFFTSSRTQIGLKFLKNVESGLRTTRKWNKMWNKKMQITIIARKMWNLSLVLQDNFLRPKFLDG